MRINEVIETMKQGIESLRCFGEAAMKLIDEEKTRRIALEAEVSDLRATINEQRELIERLRQELTETLPLPQ